MNDKCFDIGTIQAFLDGETSPALSFSVTDHTAKCDSCALLLADAEEETAQVFAMLDRELSTLVPTQRLWSNITVALADEKKHTTAWEKVRGYALALFASPSLAVAASVLVVFGLFAAVWTLRSPQANDFGPDVLASNPIVQPARPTEEVNVSSSTAPIASAPDAGRELKVGVTNLPPQEIRKLVQRADHRVSPRPARAEHAVVRETSVPEAEGYLPGEETYVRTIAGLKESVDVRKDLIMDPSTRISFERDLAVVNDSITKMKEVVRRNPKNQAAKQILYSSYQNKIDLLNSVVEREELLASIQ
jgi:hypothetical protein